MSFLQQHVMFFDYNYKRVKNLLVFFFWPLEVSSDRAIRFGLAGYQLMGNGNHCQEITSGVLLCSSLEVDIVH